MAHDLVLAWRYPTFCVGGWAVVALRNRSLRRIERIKLAEQNFDPACESRGLGGDFQPGPEV